MTAIEVTDLQKSYGGTRAVDGVSFTVAAGETFGILGHNGAGKTTTVECLIGLRRADSGTISVLGLDPVRSRRALARRIGAQLQESELPARMRVAEAMRLFSAFYDEPDDWRALLDRWSLAPIRNKAFADLSGGQKQRLQLALALVGRPGLVVLDELTTGLDPVARRETWALLGDLKAAGTTVVLVSHFMDEAEELCDRVAVFGHGRIVALGTPRELIAETGAASLEDAYLALAGETR
ncbi:ABC transporter ATP-binding protein [Nonomuraea sp. K274]|uniref:ABC transporter ATP-binding protein n=1 Tax=Nonomuraea cypriaca TaxID=1187855 RepID=A0A931EX13_9ACTN|nr:ABC transporter ATP-binding protein [Nonomuraea cypriaca]MBF8185032.1 ABC transporter ATP-binding protein [Nonomuraea cypriaca]